MRRPTHRIIPLPLISLATLLLLAAGCQERSALDAHTTAGPTPAQHAMGPRGALHISEEDRCPICAMAPHKSPKFASGIELRDGRTFYTCGTGCLIRAWLHPEAYFGTKDAEIARAIVPDYFTGAPLDATEASWVAGSDIVGPMGPAFIPLSTDADADVFVKRHGGAHRFHLSEVDDARWQQITGKPALRRGPMGHRGGGHHGAKTSP